MAHMSLWLGLYSLQYSCALIDRLNDAQAWYLPQGSPEHHRLTSWSKFSGQVCIVNRDEDKYGNHRMIEGRPTLSTGQKSL